MATLMVSAPGKVILYGEHAVVFGKAALATSVDLRCYVVLSRTGDDTVTLDLPDFNHHVQWSLTTLAQCSSHEGESHMSSLRELSGTNLETPPTQNTATLVFLYLLTNICSGDQLKDLGGICCAVLSTLPASAGLGSSAAFSVSLAASLLTLVGSISSTPPPPLHPEVKEGEDLTQSVHVPVGEESLQRRDVTVPQSVRERLSGLGLKATASSEWSCQELDVVNEWGLKAEKLIHGTPSGIDNSVSTFGGAIRFCSGKIHHLQRMPRLRILLVNTKVLRSTKKMVAGVRELRTKYPDVVGPVLDSIEAITGRAESLLDKLATISPTSMQETESCGGEAVTIHTSLQELFVLNQHLLNAVGVGHPALDQVCTLAREEGLAAKLTGAGGGGCAIILIPPALSGSELAGVEHAFSVAGFDCWETTIGSVGVTEHTITTL